MNGSKKLKPPKNPWAFNETPQNSWTQKLTPKTSHAEFPSLKNFQKASNDITLTKNNENYLARIHGHYHKSSDCFEHPKKSLLNYKAAQKFPTQKNPGIENFTPGPPKSFDHPCHLKSGVHPPPRELTDVTLLTLFVLSWGRPQCLYLGATLFFPPKYAAYLRVLLINSAVMLGTFSIRNWGIISCSWLILLFFFCFCFC